MDYLEDPGAAMDLCEIQHDVAGLPAPGVLPGAAPLVDGAPPDEVPLDGGAPPDAAPLDGGAPTDAAPLDLGVPRAAPLELPLTLECDLALWDPLPLLVGGCC